VAEGDGRECSDTARRSAFVDRRNFGKMCGRNTMKNPLVSSEIEWIEYDDNHRPIKIMNDGSRQYFEDKEDEDFQRKVLDVVEGKRRLVC
jgi:hypothetical protein